MLLERAWALSLLLTLWAVSRPNSSDAHRIVKTRSAVAAENSLLLEDDARVEVVVKNGGAYHADPGYTDPMNWKNSRPEKMKYFSVFVEKRSTPGPGGPGVGLGSSEEEERLPPTPVPINESRIAAMVNALSPLDPAVAEARINPILATVHLKRPKPGESKSSSSSSEEDTRSLWDRMLVNDIPSTKFARYFYPTMKTDIPLGGKMTPKSADLSPNELLAVAFGDMKNHNKAHGFFKDPVADKHDKVRDQLDAKVILDAIDELTNSDPDLKKLMEDDNGTEVHNIAKRDIGAAFYPMLVHAKRDVTPGHALKAVINQTTHSSDITKNQPKYNSGDHNIIGPGHVASSTQTPSTDMNQSQPKYKPNYNLSSAQKATPLQSANESFKKSIADVVGAYYRIREKLKKKLQAQKQKDFKFDITSKENLIPPIQRAPPLPVQTSSPVKRIPVTKQTLMNTTILSANVTNYVQVLVRGSDRNVTVYTSTPVVQTTNASSVPVQLLATTQTAATKESSTNDFVKSVNLDIGSKMPFGVVKAIQETADDIKKELEYIESLKKAEKKH